MRSNCKLLTLRDYLIIGVPAIILTAAAFWLTFQFVQPAPPDTIIVATANKGSPYYKLAERYQKYLAKEGVHLQIRESDGSLDNLRLLTDERSGVQAGFVQGGLTNVEDYPGLISLGRVLHEPLWIFCHKSVTFDRLSSLKGKKLLVGPEVSGTSRLAEKLLAASGVTAANATLIHMPLKDYVDALNRGEADAGFLSLGVEAVTVRRLINSENVRLVSVAQADAYLQRFPFLTRLELKEGVVDLSGNVPAADTVLLGTTAAFVVRDDLHPALESLLTQALIKAHAQPSFDGQGEVPVFQRAGQFPMSTDPEFPMSEQARRTYQAGPPILQRYFPFWVATLADRLMVMALPIIGILFPVAKLAPIFYTWRIRQRILRWYKALKELEADAKATTDTSQLAAKLAQVEEIEDAVDDTHVPIDFASQLYDLREHIDVVRRKLLARAADNRAAS